MKNLFSCYESTYVASRIAPLIINLDTKWRQVLDFTPWQLYSWRKNILTLTQRIGTVISNDGCTILHIQRNFQLDTSAYYLLYIHLG